MLEVWSDEVAASNAISQRYPEGQLQYGPSIAHVGGALQGASVATERWKPLWQDSGFSGGLKVYADRQCSCLCSCSDIPLRGVLGQTLKPPFPLEQKSSSK